MAFFYEIRLFWLCSYPISLIVRKCMAKINLCRALLKSKPLGSYKKPFIWEGDSKTELLIGSIYRLIKVMFSSSHIIQKLAIFS